jgi:hypothetical protein
MRRARLCMLTILVAAAACGGGGGGHGNTNDVATPVPTLTPTPIATAVPRVSLALTLAATTDVAGASFNVGYEAGRGSFTGTGAQTQCRLGSNDLLAVNDDDAGTLRVAILPADPLTSPVLALPTTLTCDFDETGGAVATGDLRIAAKKIGVLDASGVVVEGDASRLDVH